MAWIGGINPASVQGPDPRRTTPARDPKRAPRTVDSVAPVDNPEPVDEFEASPEAQAVRDELERAGHSAPHHVPDNDHPNDAAGPDQRPRPNHPPRLDLNA
ncbi:MAG: hypothetical protein ACTS3F_12675 [Phycisphaerales bacterium]